MAVGQSLANDGSPFWHCALFIGLTLFLLAIPLLTLLVFGERAQEAVIGLFVVLTISDLV